MEERVSGVGNQGCGWEVIFLDFDHFDGVLLGSIRDHCFSCE